MTFLRVQNLVMGLEEQVQRVENVKGRYRTRILKGESELKFREGSTKDWPKMRRFSHVLEDAENMKELARNCGKEKEETGDFSSTGTSTMDITRG
jgi:hypothetical protein